VQYDVIVVGAGAAGSALSWKLSESGIRVLCLEQGIKVAAHNYPSIKHDWELARSKSFNPDPNVRKSRFDYPINNLNSDISLANFNGVGGSTILFSGHFPRLHPSDFKVKTLDGVADDWPISYEDLEPYYNLNDSMVGVSGLSGDPAYPPIENLMPPVPLGLLGTEFAKGFNKLGWHWWPSYSAIATRDFKNRGACINLGPCNLGCSQGAKSSADVTYWPEALKNGVTLIEKARVSEIILKNNSEVSGVRYFDGDDSSKFASARIVVLAASGVGTPRLLLNSKSDFWPNGLGNNSGLVGRNLMLHPLGYVEGHFKQDLESSHGPQGCCILSQEFYETPENSDVKRGFTIQVLRGPGPVEVALQGLKRRKIIFGEKHIEWFQNEYNHKASLGLIVEDLPELTNFIDLDPNLADKNGIRAPRVHYKLGSNSKKLLSKALETGRLLMKSMDATQIVAHGPVRNAGWHILGTARMGTNAKNSVVDKTGRVHEIDNLYVADSSLFVTSGSVNPASTILALALMISDAISLRLLGKA
jgi:choline dehydrogenase-like flavoprotein